jgi:hypothetical protein
MRTHRSLLARRMPGRALRANCLSKPRKLLYRAKMQERPGRARIASGARRPRERAAPRVALDYAPESQPGRDQLLPRDASAHPGAAATDFFSDRSLADSSGVGFVIHTWFARAGQLAPISRPIPRMRSLPSATTTMSRDDRFCCSHCRRTGTPVTGWSCRDENGHRQIGEQLLH